MPSLADLIHAFNRTDGLAAGELVDEGGRATARFADLSLTSAFQPIVNVEKQRTMGHEALLRVTSATAEAMPPAAVFDRSTESADIVGLDRLARILHALNFLAQRQRAGGYLYLNLHPRHMKAVSSHHGLVFEAILKRCGLAPADIVLEVQESAIEDDAHLMAAVKNYRQRGYLIAIDDFGWRHCNLDRLWRLQPEIVKLEGGMIAAAVEDERVAVALARQVDIAHALGATVVVKGVETATQLTAARQAGADLVQGYFLGEPDPECRPTHRGTDVAYNPVIHARGNKK